MEGEESEDINNEKKKVMQACTGECFQKYLGYKTF